MKLDIWKSIDIYIYNFILSYFYFFLPRTRSNACGHGWRWSTASAQHVWLRNVLRNSCSLPPRFSVGKSLLLEWTPSTKTQILTRLLTPGPSSVWVSRLLHTDPVSRVPTMTDKKDESALHVSSSSGDCVRSETATIRHPRFRCGLRRMVCIFLFLSLWYMQCIVFRWCMPWTVSYLTWAPADTFKACPLIFIIFLISSWDFSL